MRDMKRIKMDRFKEEDGDERELGKGDKWVKGCLWWRVVVATTQPLPLGRWGESEDWLRDGEDAVGIRRAGCAYYAYWLYSALFCADKPVSW